MMPLSRRNLLPDLQATGKKDALAELAAAAAARIGLAPGRVLAALQERESLGSTALGEGYAVPHTRLDDLVATAVFFTRSRKGVAFEALDNHPVHLFFLLLVPTNPAVPYLSVLAELSAFLGEPTVRVGLLQAAAEESLLAVLNGGPS